MPEIPQLSTGVLPLMMSGEEITGPILQILGVKRIMSGATERVRLLVSDGRYFNSYTMMATQMNFLFHQGMLPEGTIVRVDKYITSVVNRDDPTKRVLIILEITVLRNDNVEIIGELVQYNDPSVRTKIPILSTDVIPRIMSGETIERPIFQILDIRTTMSGDTERVYLSVSDGKYFNDQSMLAPQLKSLYDKGKLLKGTVIRVDKYMTDAIKINGQEKQVLIITELNIFISREINIIGEPVSYEDALCPPPKMHKLSLGVLPVIMSGEYIECPVFQILGGARFMNGDKESISLSISDGKYFNSDVMMDTHLNFMYHEKRLAEGTIFRADKYITYTTNENDTENLTLMITEMTVLTPGPKDTIGGTVNYKNPLPLPSNSPALSNNVLPKIMSGESKDCPILQILGLKKMSGMTKGIHLVVSDGKYFNSYAMLGPQLNFMYYEDKLPYGTIVKVNNYVTSVANRNEPEKLLLMILDMTILTEGFQLKIGNPVDYYETLESSAYVHPFSTERM
ncbi:uncharacterized protein [Musca autumnalis]|uniref:uncharacterized protein n=1 Tax=Musca autumnalis TaxID=221902 RepID=UPI003CFAE2C8